MTVRRPIPLTLALSAVLAIAALAIQTAARRPVRPAAPPVSMAAMLPQGELLTIESPDFASVLHAWTASPESAAWLHSANYSVFANSRLFGRLTDAQSEFASTAKLSAAGTAFLQSIAGKQSIFAWYDIGNLEFLYITHLSPDRAAQTELLLSRGKFSRRQAGASVFFVRTGSSPNGQPRTVAFATTPSGLLLLATREDLIANALQLIAHPTPANSALAEPWYSAALATVPAQAATPDLRMVLNLERLVPSPYFRSYWVQRNVTEMKQYRAAVADLYREPTQFREERSLLLTAPPASPSADPNLAPLAALPPSGTGVFRAMSTQDPADAILALNEKLLGHPTLPPSPAEYAPDADLTPTLQGSASDLETRIDTPPLVPESASTSAFSQALVAAGLQAVLTLDSAGEPASDQSTQPTVFLPIRSAIVLQTTHPLDPGTFATALQQALRGSLTTSNLGIELHPTLNPAIFALNGPKPLYTAIQGTLCLLSNDEPLLTTLLTRIPRANSAPPTRAVLIGAFDHTTQRAPYNRLTRAIDHATAPSSSPASSPNGSESSTNTSPFFSTNIRSLSDAFAPLASEHILTTHQGELLHQTVLYQWQP